LLLAGHVGRIVYTVHSLMLPSSVGRELFSKQGSDAMVALRAI